MGAIITLTTDFGLADSYVAALKGVILGINPEARLVDITHQITPHNINQAAFVLGSVYPYFPPKTIHLIVVDPGVGTKRRAIILRTPPADFIAPDNGVLSYVVQQFATKSQLGPELEAVAITNPKYWRTPVSNTFHGRDIFAAVAAHLALGVPIREFGQPVTSVMVLPLPKPFLASDGSLTGQVIHIDSFGNLITNIKDNDLPDGTPVIEIGKQTINGLSRTYAEIEGLLALIGSSGYLEISLKEGSASVFLSAQIGSEVKVRGGKQ